MATKRAGVAVVSDATAVMRRSPNPELSALSGPKRPQGKSATEAVRAERFEAWLLACPPEWREFFDAP